MINIMANDLNSILESPSNYHQMRSAFQYIKNNQINREKWDDCISKSCNSRVYGLSWYLDIVCENWDGIIFGDYEAVFPVIFSRKMFFIKTSYHPLFCQQLGLFFKSGGIADKLISQLSGYNFIWMFHATILPTYFKRYIYHATHEFSTLLKGWSGFHSMFNTRTIWMSNLTLKLGDPYNVLRNKYNTNTIRNLKKSSNFNLKIKELEVDIFMDLYKKNKNIRRSIQKFYPFKNHNYLIIKKLISTCLKKKRGRLIGVFNQEKCLVSAAFFLSCFKRKIMLFNVTKPNCKEYHAMTFLIDNFIKSNCEQNLILDFEGSNIEGVRKFYKGFGSYDACYTRISPMHVRLI